MSEFRDTYNSDAVECPYCGEEYQPESEDYSEDEREEECSGCGSTYHVHQSFLISHQARPDCELNGKKHNYKSITFKNGKSAPFCTVCDNIQPHSERLTTHNSQ